jgi:SAM-dependent methyltransferase
VLDYERESRHYDTLRGGEPRAAAAAEALLGLIPDGARTLLDVACGTGIVTRRLARPGLEVTGADLTHAMARLAADRLPGRIVLADARRLPFADASFDVVTSVWLLHLLDAPEDVPRVMAECARVLRPGGTYITTVDKAASHNVGSDIDAVMADRPRRPAADAEPRVAGLAADLGLRDAGRSRFRGRGQGRSPRRTIADLRRGWFTQLPPGDPRADAFAARLAALPDQDRPRPDPVFTLRAFRKTGAGHEG